MAMPNRLRAGVLGLGRRWRRCLPLLPGLRGVLEVAAVCDPRPGRAERAARALGCGVADGAVELLERDDVGALLLFDPPWYGLWPLDVAARLGKPAFCAAPLTADDAHADALHEAIRAAGLPVLMALPTAAAPSLARLNWLLNNHLGSARLVRAERVLHPPEGRDVGAADLLAGPASLGLLHAAAALLGGPPRGVRAGAADGFPLVNLLLDADGRAAQVSVWADPNRGRACRVEVVADRGTAVAEGPRKLHWRNADGEHLQRLPPLRRPRALLEHFARSVSAGRAPRPSFADAYEALVTLRAARRSLAEGRRVEVAVPAPEQASRGP
jgi:predicted dehydrogenase